MGEHLGGRAARVLAVAAIAAASTGLAGASAGCGSGDNDTATTVHSGRDPYAYARARFREMCAGCHTLADADAHGRRFNLDNVPTLTRAFVRNTIAEGEPGMPAWRDVLSPREFEEIARYVYAVARRQRGETNWSWQVLLRQEGEQNPPTLPDKP